MTKTKIFLVGVLAFILGAVSSAALLSASPSGQRAGGTSYHNSHETFGGGAEATDLDVTATLDVTGAVTFASTFSVAGEFQAGRVVQGGSVLTIASTATTSPSAAQICDNSIIQWTPNVASADLTLPTAAQLAADCLDTNGDSITLLYRNLSAVGSTTEIIAGVGIVLVGPSSTAAGSDFLDGAREARLWFSRVSSTEVVAGIDGYAAAD